MGKAVSRSVSEVACRVAGRVPGRSKTKRTHLVCPAGSRTGRRRGLAWSEGRDCRQVTKFLSIHLRVSFNKNQKMQARRRARAPAPLKCAVAWRRPLCRC